MRIIRLESFGGVWVDIKLFTQPILVERIHSWSGFSLKLECNAFPTLSTIAEVVIDDSMHRIAVMASNRVTSFLNISLACAESIKH